MKKQFQILAATFITVALISCSKEKIETPVTNQQGEEVTALNSPGGPIVINPLNVGLLGRFEFNGNLKDTTKKLADADPTGPRITYTTDRKGQAKKAIRFNGTYGLEIFDVPSFPENSSVSLWVKDDIVEGPNWYVMLRGQNAFSFQQSVQAFGASFLKGISIFQHVGTTPIDDKWHHIAATRDNTSLKLYIDGVLIGTSPSPAESLPPSSLNKYQVAYGPAINHYWKGSVDDLRFYKRVLSQTEVQALYNL